MRRAIRVVCSVLLFSASGCSALVPNASAQTPPAATARDAASADGAAINACMRDNECALDWVEPCAATACVPASQARHQGSCHAATVPSGRCGCASGHCAMIPLGAHGH